MRRVFLSQRSNFSLVSLKVETGSGGRWASPHQSPLLLVFGLLYHIIDHLDRNKYLLRISWFLSRFCIVVNPKLKLLFMCFIYSSIGVDINKYSILSSIWSDFKSVISLSLCSNFSTHRLLFSCLFHCHLIFFSRESVSTS